MQAETILILTKQYELMILWELLTWLIFGLVVGFVANLLDPNKDEGGILGYIILGVLGAILGGYLADLLGIRDGDDNQFSLTSLVTSVIGSLILLFLYRFIRGNVNRPNR